MCERSCCFGYWLIVGFFNKLECVSITTGKTYILGTQDGQLLKQGMFIVRHCYQKHL
jgi:hypothetical protein